MNFRALLFLFAITLASAASAENGSYAASSRLAQGHWVKIRISDEGIQEISHEQLRQWGFDRPEEVAAYGYGGTALALGRLFSAPTDLIPTPALHTTDGRMLFYGDAAERFDLRNFDAIETATSENTTLWRRNAGDNFGYYFLSDCEGPAKGSVIAAPASLNDDAPAYIGHIHVDITDIDRISPLSVGPVFCEKDFTDAKPYEIPISIVDPVLSECSDGAARNAALAYYIVVKNGSWSNTAQATHLFSGDIASRIARQNPARPPRYQADDYVCATGTAQFTNTTAAPLRDITGALAVSPSAALSSFVHYMDRHALAYPRRNRLPEGTAQLILQYPESDKSRPLRIADATSSQQLWNISDPCAVSILELKPDGEGGAYASMPAAFSAASPGRLILFDTEATHHSPEFCGEVATQNIHGSATPDMVIITTDVCEPSARLLAEAHARIDGMDVAVFTNTQVLNEFSSGASTPVAYRRLARMFHDRDPEKFRHILLMGSSTWDPRGITQHFVAEMLPLHECDVPSARMMSNTCYASDVYTGCLDDFDYTQGHRAKMTVSVGRIPARTPGEAASIVAHTIDYMENPPSAAFFHRALMVSAEGDDYEHYNYSEEMTAVIESSGKFVVTRLPMMAYPLSNNNHTESNMRLRDYLGEGRGFFSYFGHSSYGNSLGNGFYSCIIAETIDYDVPPYAFLATCNAFNLDKDMACLAPTMTARAGGGAIGVVGAARSVFSDANRHLGIAMARAYSEATQGATTGDIFREAHNSVMNYATSSVPINTKCYNLCGDPAVRLPIAGGAVRLISAQTDGADEVAGLSVLRLSGEITDILGDNVDADFDGSVEIIVYDTPVAGSVQIPSGTGTKPTLEFSNVRIATATAPVANGQWTAEIFIPEFSNPGKTFAISADAVATTQDARTAHGYFRSLPTAAEPASTDGLDTSAPEIVEMYVGSPDFRDGDVTGPAPTVYARISVPATGLNINTAPLSGPTRISIDGSDSRSNISGYMQPDGEGFMLLTMPYSGLAEGRHYVTLSAANNLGITSERTVGFTVAATQGEATISVEEHPARTSATFSVDHNLGSDASYTIIIEDHTGATVSTCSGTWDLTDAGGTPVADGVYRAYALVRDGLRVAHTQPTEVIVVRAAEQ